MKRVFLIVFFLAVSIQSDAAKMSSYTENTTPNADVYFIGVDPNDTSQTVNGSNYRYSINSIMGLGLIDAVFNSLSVTGTGDSWLELNNNASFVGSLVGKYGYSFLTAHPTAIINGTTSRLALYSEVGSFAFDTFPTYEDSAHSSGIAVNGTTLAVYSETASKWLTVGLTDALDPTPSAPILSSATLGTNGTTLTLVFDQAVSHGSGYTLDDFNVDASVTGNDIAMTYAAGDTTDTHVMTLASTVNLGETVDFDFLATADSMENGSGDDLAAIVSAAVTNNSTQGGACTTPASGNLFNEGFEGTGYETVSGITETGTVNEDAARPSTDPGSLCDSVIRINGGAANYITIDEGTSRADVYVTFWIYAADVASGSTVNIGTLAGSSPYYERPAQWEIFNNGGQYQIRMQGAGYSSFVNITSSAWHRVDLHIVQNASSSMSVDGGAAQTFTADNYTVRYYNFGEWAGGDACSIYYDRIHISTAVIE